MRIILLGSQGSGKGTQAALLAKKLDIPKIATGDILRENEKKGSELGKLAASYMNKGILIPDDIINKIVEERIRKNDCKKGYILDGYPRNINQAEMLGKITDINYLIEIVISDREAIRRISGRRSCKCGEVYHTFYNPPKVPEVCDKCRSRLFQREDDKEELVRKRLRDFHKETEPLIKFYKDKHIRINGEQSIEKVFEGITKALP